VRGARIDREAHADAAESQRVFDRARERRKRVLVVVQDVVVVQLQDQGNLSRELARARLDEAERGRVGVASGVDGELEVITRVVRAGPCSKPWSTGRITSLPVPASLPWFNSRARFVFVPGLSLEYQSRISFTLSCMASSGS
jgi:hypothetical protein